LPEDDLVFFLLETIPELDLSAFYEYYSTDGRGHPTKTEHVSTNTWTAS